MSELIIKDITNKNSGSFKLNDINFKLTRENTQKNNPLGTPNKIVFHWTAGFYHQLFDFYHYNITEINDKVFVFKLLNTNEMGQHVWRRSTGSIGISFCCMGGREPKVAKPTENMLTTGSELAAEICAWKELKPNDKVTLPKMINGAIVPGNVTVDVVSDHAQYAKNDGYYPNRWDIGKYIGSIKENTLDVYQQLKSNKRQFKFVEIIK